MIILFSEISNFPTNNQSLHQTSDGCSATTFIQTTIRTFIFISPGIHMGSPALESAVIIIFYMVMDGPSRLRRHVHACENLVYHFFLLTSRSTRLLLIFVCHRRPSHHIHQHKSCYSRDPVPSLRHRLTNVSRPTLLLRPR